MCSQQGGLQSESGKSLISAVRTLRHLNNSRLWSNQQDLLRQMHNDSASVSVLNTRVLSTKSLERQRKPAPVKSRGCLETFCQGEVGVQRGGDDDTLST